MVEQQPELDLPLPRQSGARRKRALFAGFSRGQLVAIVLLACALVWSMWVTKRLLTPERDHIVAARLSNIVGEYVQAQARSNTDPQEVQGEMRRFMAALETELQRRGANGQVVLVGEAILSKNVPDITASVATAGDRLHYITDLASNVAVLGGLGLSVALDWLWADGVVGLVVAGWLAWGAFGVAQAGVDELMDRELPDAEREEIRRLASAGPGIKAMHQLRTRRAGPHVHITFHADMDASLTLAEAHRLMVAAEDRIRTAFPRADILIHPDPEGQAEDHGLPHLAVKDH
jgi:cation diffusion facilitator family transporter